MANGELITRLSIAFKVARAETECETEEYIAALVSELLQAIVQSAPCAEHARQSTERITEMMRYSVYSYVQAARVGGADI